MSVLRRLAPAAAILVLVVVILALGIANPVRGSSVRTDALGPDNDETAQQYIERVVAPDGAGGDRWALVSFTRSLRAAEVISAVDGARVSIVYVHVPIERVQTPLIQVSVPDTDSVVAQSVRDSAALVSPGRDQRGSDVATVVRGRLLEDCACVAGILVRADTGALGAVADGADVRVVQALPADAVLGRFAVAPLYPERTADAVQPDDGPVPTS